MDIDVSASVTLSSGSFIVSNDAGIKFTPAENVTLTESMQDVLFIGYDNDNVLDENNIEIGAVCNIDTPLAGVVSVSNSTVTGGAKDEFPDTDEGDELYRQYIIAKRSAVSVGGPAAAYEQRAKEADGRVLDAYCVRYNDSQWEAGKAKVYILTQLSSADEEDEVLERVQIALTNDAWKPVCDTVEVHLADLSMIYPVFTVGLTAVNAISGQAKFERDIREYCEYLTTHLGEPFSLSELCRRAQTPDENGVKTEYVTLTNPMYNYLVMGKTESFRRIEWSVSSYEII